jgi:uncharacterized protein (TIGR00252 family)
MTNYASGHAAEKLAAEYLKVHGFKVVELNWRTRYCEIDIVAKKKRTIYFVEVKSRKNRQYGDSLEYVTNKKLKKMRFAAEIWLQTNNWHGDYELAAIGIDGNAYTFIDSIAV